MDRRIQHDSNGGFAVVRIPMSTGMSGVGGCADCAGMAPAVAATALRARVARIGLVIRPMMLRRSNGLGDESDVDTTPPGSAARAGLISYLSRGTEHNHPHNSSVDGESACQQESSGQDRHVVGGECRISGHDREPLAHRLGDQPPIERIAMV